MASVDHTAARAGHVAPLCLRESSGTHTQPCCCRVAVLLTGLRLISTHAPYEPVAQVVEHLTFNQVVLGSSPSRLTIFVN